MSGAATGGRRTALTSGASLTDTAREGKRGRLRGFGLLGCGLAGPACGGEGGMGHVGRRRKQAVG